MKIEARADNSTRITGYVNVTERESRPVITPRGKVTELVESGVFQKALDEADEVRCSVDHERQIATTKDGTLILKEDNIGLWAELRTTDEEVAEAGRKGTIKGWSFGMKKVKDAMEERADMLPLRRIRGMMLDHVTLVLHKQPVYSATSVELRAGEEEDIETRAYAFGDVTVEAEERKTSVDHSKWEERLQKLKGE